MPTRVIRAVLFDMGGTLEDVTYDDAMRLRATRGLQAILACNGLDPRTDVAGLHKTVAAGMKAYQDWREQSEVELPSARVWTEYVFSQSHMPAERLADIGEKLSFFYDTQFYSRTLRPEVPAMLATLRERGFRLGVISNVVSLGQVAHSLESNGLTHYFDVVVTSSGLGCRKPNSRIFLEATRQMDVLPGECAYVGDTISRDVVGARRAGYALAIQIKSFLTGVSDRGASAETPDVVVGDLSEVPNVVTAWMEERA